MKWPGGDFTGWDKAAGFHSKFSRTPLRVLNQAVRWPVLYVKKLCGEWRARENGSQKSYQEAERIQRSVDLERRMVMSIAYRCIALSLCPVPRTLQILVDFILVTLLRDQLYLKPPFYRLENWGTEKLNKLAKVPHHLVLLEQGYECAAWLTAQG